jgi:hypothetical protein
VRTSNEFLSLQFAYRPEDLDEIVAPGTLSTARFESVYREISGFGQLDLIFERDDQIFVAHAIGVDVVSLATLEGPALLWPSTLRVAPPLAEGIEEFVTPWLLSLSRGRGMAGEYVRAFRPSAAFDEARERKFRGAVPNAVSLPLMAPFVYARRFAAGRDVRVACSNAELAAGVVATVARSVRVVGETDAFARRWYGVPEGPTAPAPADVAIVDRSIQLEAVGALYVVALRPEENEPVVIVPQPVAQDHLFTFDAADAPEVGRFSVLAHDRVERAVRAAEIPPAAMAGTSGLIAIVVRDDALFAEDADTDACNELARRLCCEGFEASVMTAADPRLAQADLVHIFGGIDDAHVTRGAEAARAARLPYFISIDPLAPYTRYYEEGLNAALRLGEDERDKRYFLRLFCERRLHFDEIPIELSAEATAKRDAAFENICSGASAVFLSPCDAPEAYCARFPRVPADRVIGASVLLAPEPQEAPVAHLLPARRFLLVHAPFTKRSTLGHLLASLGEIAFDVVVAGPVSEVAIAFTLRRVAGSSTVFLPDPTPGEVTALYRRAHAVAIPMLRPAGAQRLVRSVLSGALPLVARSSPLARLVPPDCQFDERSREATAAFFEAAMAEDQRPRVARLAGVLQMVADQRMAIRSIVDMYARVASATPR